MSDIFREIDEDIQADRLKAMWQQFGPWVIGAAVAVILGVAGRVGWNSYIENRQSEESLRFGAAQELLESGDRDAAIAAFGELADETSTGYGALAAFMQAAQLIEAGDKSGALAIYDGLAEDGDVTERMQGLASVLAVMTALDVENSDAIRARLIPLSVDGGNWYFSAQELLALVEMKDGNMAEAQQILSNLMVNQLTPDGIRQRAQQMLEVVEVEMGTIDVTPTDNTDNSDNPPQDGNDEGAQ